MIMFGETYEHIQPDSTEHRFRIFSLSKVILVIISNNYSVSICLMKLSFIFSHQPYVLSPNSLQVTDDFKVIC